jgi:Holliday junction resolvasome RuvABC DNA-binding subunit
MTESENERLSKEVERLRAELDQTAQLADRLAKGYNEKHDETERLRPALRLAIAALDLLGYDTTKLIVPLSKGKK